VDRRTRQRHARQELIVLWSLSTAVTIVLLAWSLVARHWSNVVMGGGLSPLRGLDLVREVRRRP
jgi:hypothetical protein